jgi:hypothetical protein
VRRREFFAALSGAAAWPFVANAQQSAMPVVGDLAAASPEANAIRLHAFHEGLNAGGFTEAGTSASIIDGRKRTPVGSRRSRQSWFAIRLQCL